MAIELWEHQKEAVRLAKEQRDFALFFQVGTGKSATLVNILEDKYRFYGSMESTLILCPLIMVRKWKQELLTFGTKIPAERIVLLQGSIEKRSKELFKKEAELYNKLIVVTNYEAIINQRFREALYEWAPKYLICDESHKLKDPTAKRTKAAINIADKAEHRFILTGTPILNTPLDIFSQFRVLDKGDTFGTTFAAFKYKYFWDQNGHRRHSRNYFPKWEIRKESVPILNKMISTKSMQVKKEDCLDLPPLIHKIIPVELGEEQLKAYLEMKKEFVTFIKDKACAAPLALTKGLRLQQILSGFLPVEDINGNEDLEIFGDNPRREALKDILEQIVVDNKVIIWACFKQDYKTIADVCSEVGAKYVQVHGEISPKVKFDAVEKFNKDPKIKVMIGHPGSLGIGIDLIAASYSIFYSRNFSLENDVQAEARNYRAGSEIHKKITRIDLVAKGTLDDLILKALVNKQKIGEEMLRDFSLELEYQDK